MSHSNPKHIISSMLFIVSTLMLGCETVDPYEDDSRGACYQWVESGGWNGDVDPNGECEDDVSKIECESEEQTEGVSATFYEAMSCDEAGY